ncbi:uncharacterized protein LOC134262321 [Saccostrea cucullata]|uniref:uncharacterized protein LOC134262321 n=1 Tax=Saccostrea cuccullata TaxID=36930 RepID=UPI002ED49B53
MKLVSTVLLWHVMCCYGDGMQHLVLLDNLPAAFQGNVTPDLIVTTNFSGSVSFKESSDFKVLLNISSPSIDDAYSVKSAIEDSKGRLLIQVFEERISGSVITLPWIFTAIGVGAFIVAGLAILWAAHWYCTKQHLKLQQDNLSYGNVMKRSRHSIHLSSTHAGESVGQDGEETLMGVPEEPEEEEAENRKMAEVRLSHHFEDDDDNEEKEFLPKQRQASSARTHRQYVRQHGHRKRHPSLNDPPSYNTVMDYPNSDDSDGEGNTHKRQLEPLIEGSQASIDKKSESSFTYQEMDVRLYRGINQPVLPVARSDGDIENRNSARQKGNYQIPQLGKLSSSKASSRSSIKRDEPTTPQENSRGSIRRDELPPTPQENSRSSLRRHEPITPQEERARTPLIGAEVYDKTSMVGDNTSGIVQMGTVRGPPVQPPLSPVEPGTPKVDSNPMDIPLTSFSGTLQRQKSGRTRTTSLFIDPEAPEDKDVFEVEDDEDDDDDDIFAPRVPGPDGRKRHISGDSRTRHLSGERHQGERIRHPSGEGMYRVPTGSSPARAPLGSSPARNPNDGSPARQGAKSSPSRYPDNRLRNPQVDRHRQKSGDRNRYSVTSDGSMYDSTEIFKKKGTDNNYEDIDSDMDFEIPPLESDADVLSDVSLPLPSPPAFVKQASKEPRSPLRSFAYDEAPTAMSLPLSPFMDFSGGTYITIAASPSSTVSRTQFVFPDSENLPPPPPDSQLNGGEASGESSLPPPPKLFHPPQRPSWHKTVPSSVRNGGPDHSNSSKNGGPEYAKIQRQGSQRAEPDNAGQSGEPATEAPTRSGSVKRKNIPARLHLTIVCTLCILSLIGGVYSKVNSSGTKVHITVYAPKHFFTQKIEVFFHQDKPAYVVDNPYKVQAYDVKEPKLENLNSSKCYKSLCPQGCDEDTGQCICKKGYRPDSHNKCQDVNECRDGSFLCHEDAGCLNMIGSYYCICSPPFYGNGKSCEECNAPCRPGTYQKGSCGNNQQKQCIECTDQCEKGFYMYSKCGKMDDASCRMCQGECLDNQYEYQRCTQSQNRVCKGRGDLKPPMVSGNVIVEDRDDTYKNDMTTVRHRESAPGQNTQAFMFSKGSGFYIEVALKYLHPAPMFSPVNHSRQNELDSFKGDQSVLTRYCPYPMPIKHELYYKTHKNITYKERQRYGHTQIKPCTTYTQHGQYPPQDSTTEGSIMCSEPGPVSSVFSVLDSQFTTSTSTWVEKSESCLLSNAACLNCTRHCAKQMLLQRGECSISGGDNGQSPRLPECFTCCTQSNCSDVCKTYHDYICQTERCKQGDLIEFKLKPVYHPKDDFLCHMTPLPNQKLLELEYTIKHYYNTLMTQSFTIYGDEMWQKFGKLKSDKHIVKVEVESMLDIIPDIIEGSPGQRDVTVGKYKTSGESVRSSYIQGSTAPVRPTKPYIETSKTFGKKHCDDDALENLISINSGEPYTHLQTLQGRYLGNYTYVITNSTAQSLVKIGVAKHASILSSLYPGATLKEGSIKGNISHNSTHWNLNVTGEVVSCPGILNVNITDPDYPNRPLYQYDIQVKCPPHFSLVFSVPSGDASRFNKQFIISVKDNLRKSQLHVYRASASQLSSLRGRESQSVHSTEAVVPPHFSVPFIVSVCGGVLLLIFVSTVGIVVKFGQPLGDVLQFRWCHLVLMVFYVTFQFIYAACVSITVFYLIIIASNSDTTAFLKNYQHQRSVKTAFSNLELDHLQRHLQVELQRQREIAAASKHQCQVKMKRVVKQFNDMNSLLEKEVKDRIMVENIKNLLSRHTEGLIQDFTSNLNNYKEHYKSYIKHTKKVFAANIEETYRSVERSKWLAGPDFLQKAVKNFRDLDSLPTKPFMEWLGIPQDLTQISGDDVSIPLPQTPRLSKVFNSGSHSSGQADTVNFNKPERTVHKHNMWFFADDPFKAKENQTRSQTGQGHATEKEPRSSNYTGFFFVMAVIDIMWFLHRILKSLGVAKLLLYGYPIFVGIREKTNERNPDGSARRQSQIFQSGASKTFKKFFIKTLSSMFVPKVIATIFVCLFIYLISVTTFHFVNRETFSYLGYYNNMDDLLKLNEDFVNRRIESQASRINTMEYPTYQELMNMYVQRHLYLHRTIESQWHHLQEAHSGFYCRYKQSLEPNAKCSDPLQSRFGDKDIEVCHFEQIEPNFYSNGHVSDSSVAEIQMDAFLTNIRKLISDTCYILLIYMSVIIIKELLGTVIWLYLKRSAFINLRLIYEADKPPPTATGRER